jgi:hypothetical protein
MNRDKIQLLNAKLTVINSKIRYLKSRNFTDDTGIKININPLKKKQFEIKEKIQGEKNV